MPFNSAPQSWLTNYSFSSDNISFDLAADYTTSVTSDPLKLIFRVVDDILKKYEGKPQADRPVQWTSMASYTQPTPESPNTIKNITNSFVLDAQLFSELRTPSLDVTVTTPDAAFSGLPYSNLSYTAPTGSSVSVSYSSDGGQTYTGTAPTAKGFYYAKVVASLGGKTGEAISTFTITKISPTVIPPSNITQVFTSVGTQTVNYSTNAPIVSVVSNNPAAVSVVSFNSSGAVTLQKNAIGDAAIVATTSETADYYAVSSQFVFSLTTIPSVITPPGSINLNL